MSGSETERELLSSAIAGDEMALDELLLAHYSQLTDYISTRLPSKIQGVVSAEDIVQQAFVRAMHHVGHFLPGTEQSFHAWLRRIAENVLRDAIKTHNRVKRGGDRRQVRQAAMSDKSAMVDLVEALAAESNTPSRSVARHEAIAAVHEAVGTLPEEYRQAVQLRLFEGKSLIETASIMSRSPRAVQGLVDRAKKKMRAALGSLSLYE